MRGGGNDETVSPGCGPPRCVGLDVTVTYARDSFVDSQGGPFVLLRGGGGGGRHPGTRLTIAFFLQTNPIGVILKMVNKCRLGEQKIILCKSYCSKLWTGSVFVVLLKLLYL